MGSSVSLAELASHMRGYMSSHPSGHESRCLRAALGFVREAESDRILLAQLVEEEPEPTGDARFDALLAAVAEHLCVRNGLPAPGWSLTPSRFLDGFWWVSPLPSARTYALLNTPASFRRRGVMLERRELEDER